MPLKLNSFSGGSVTLDPASTTSDFTLSLPAVTGTVVTTGSSAVVTQAMLSQGLTRMTAQNSTSGTFIDFTGIPSWVRRITLMFTSVSTNGASHYLIQIGSGSIATTGYVGAGNYLQGAVASGGLTSAAGFPIFSGNAANIQTGHCVITLMTGTTWVASGVTAFENAAINGYTAGRVSLSGALDRIRFTTVNGTDAFDSGSMNVMYE